MLEGLDTTKPVALFDVDGVLVNPYVIFRFANYLSELGNSVFPHELFEKMKIQRNEYKAHKDYEKFAKQWVDTYALGLVDCPVAQIRAHARDFWYRESTNLLFDYTQTLINIFKIRNTHTIIAISGSTEDGLEPLKDQDLLGFEYICASEVPHNGEIFIEGNAENRAIRQGKQKVVDYLIAILPSHLWDKSFGFGDHPLHDSPLLLSVGSPYFFLDPELLNGTEFSSQVKWLQNELKGRLITLEKPVQAGELVDMVEIRLNQLGL